MQYTKCFTRQVLDCCIMVTFEPTTIDNFYANIVNPLLKKYELPDDDQAWLKCVRWN
jgi:hypothetical protein